jgi:hypothetical protein
MYQHSVGRHQTLQNEKVELLKSDPDNLARLNELNGEMREVDQQANLHMLAIADSIAEEQSQVAALEQKSYLLPNSAPLQQVTNMLIESLGSGRVIDQTELVFNDLADTYNRSLAEVLPKDPKVVARYEQRIQAIQDRETAKATAQAREAYGNYVEEIKQKNNRVEADNLDSILEGLDQNFPKTKSTDYSENRAMFANSIRKGVEAELKSAKEEANKLFTEAEGHLEKTMVPMDETRDLMDSLIEFRDELDANNPNHKKPIKKIDEIIAKFNKELPLSSMDIYEAQKAVNASIKRAYLSGNPDDVLLPILNRTNTAIEASLQGDQEGLAAFRMAKKFYKDQIIDRFYKNKEIKPWLELGRRDFESLTLVSYKS